jgi:hypothetical protein
MFLFLTRALAKAAERRLQETKALEEAAAKMKIDRANKLAAAKVRVLAFCKPLWRIRDMLRHDTTMCCVTRRFAPVFSCRP